MSKKLTKEELYDNLEELMRGKILRVLVTALSEYCKVSRIQVETGLILAMMDIGPSGLEPLEALTHLISFTFGFCKMKEKGVTKDNYLEHVDNVKRRFVALLDEDSKRKLGYIT